jgi:hypothetical protein
METVTDDDFSFDTLTLQPPLKISSDCNPFSIAMEVVASCPPFLRKEDCPWVLAHMAHLRDYYDEKYGHSSDLCRDRNTRYWSLLGKIQLFARENDILSLTRMMYALDVVNAIFFGEQVEKHDYFTHGDDRSWFSARYDVQFVNGLVHHPEIYKRINVDYDKQFKTSMTRNVYKGASVMVKIPNGEELSAVIFGDKAIALTPGNVFECTVVRFYKTDPCWANRATFEFYPTIKADLRDRLQCEPLFAVEMDMARDIQGKLWGATINAFIPLHWITHVYHDGEYLEVNDFPTALKTDSKLPVPMTGEDFTQFHFLRG